MRCHFKLTATITLNTGLDNDTWLSLASSFGNDYQGATCSLEALAAYVNNTGKRWIGGKNQLRLH